MTSADQNFTNKDNFMLKSNHPMAMSWSLHINFGIIGVILNGIVFHNVLQERKKVITSVNVLIG